jgi:hypothetical protein
MTTDHENETPLARCRQATMARERSRPSNGGPSWPLAVLIAISLCQANARAESPSSTEAMTVEEHLSRGVELRKEGRDAEALEEFRAAYRLDKSARVRAQIAVAEQALGHWVEAERGLVLVLATEEDPWIEERRKALEQALARIKARLATLLVQANVIDAELRVDGVRIATLPASEPVRVVAGSHVLEVIAQGYLPARRTVELAASGRTQEHFLLTPVPLARPPFIAPENREGAPTNGLSLSRLTWVSFGIFGGLVTAGATALAIREINAAHYNDGTRCVAGSLSREERCGGYRGAANGAEFVAIGAFSAAGLAAIGAGLSLGHDLLKHRREEATLHCGLGWGGVSCNGSF